MKWYYNAVTILVLSIPAELYPGIKCNSRVLPDIPTERDSVFIETCNYIVDGNLTDSSLSIVGNNILITYAAVYPPTTVPFLEVRRNHIGTLPAGSYNVITTGYYIRPGAATVDTTGRSHDTVRFEVLPAAAKPLRVVGYTLFTNYLYVDDFHPRRSYFYWNGDTLTIGMAFYYGCYANKFFTGIRQSSDTIVIDIVDTTLSGALAFNGYVAVTSLAPVPQSSHHVRIRRWNWGPYSTYSDPNFHQFTADTHSHGIGLSFRKPGRVEYILYPNDTMYMAFPLLSPFLDTLNILGFQPNPYYKPTGTNRIFLHDIHHGNTLIENWETYDKKDWQYVSVQESDRIAFDTVSNSTNGDHWIRMTYSNENDEPVKGYYYKTLDQPLVSSLAQPFVGIYGAIKPDSAVSPVEQQPSPAGKPWAAPVVGYTGAHITVRFSSGNPGKAMVTDIRGRLVRVLDGKTLHKTGKGTVAVWDRRDFQGNPVPKGVYLIHAESLSGRNCTILTVR